MDRLNKRITLVGAVFLLLFLLLSPFVFMPNGRVLFNEQKCITCHRFREQGGLTGPDLTGVINRRSTIWLVRQIRNPQSHNPNTRMPSYDHLDYFETYAIISYLKS